MAPSALPLALMTLTSILPATRSRQGCGMMHYAYLGANARIYGKGTITGCFRGIRINNNAEGARIQNMTMIPGILLALYVDADKTTLISHRADNFRTGITIASNNNVVRTNQDKSRRFWHSGALDSEGTVVQANRAHDNTAFDLSGSCDLVTWKSNTFDTANKSMYRMTG